MSTARNSEPPRHLKYDPSMSYEDNLLSIGCPSSPPDFNLDVPAGPLLQIFSIYVSTKFDECEIYGVIRATEVKDDTTFDLYNRDPSEYEAISKDYPLSLTGPNGSAILGNEGVTIDICLKDRARNIYVINVQHYLDCVNYDSRDKLMKAVIQGEHGCVSLYYTTFTFALYAIVEIPIRANFDQNDCVHGVYGSLVASYGNSRKYCTTDNEVKYLETKLFEKALDTPERVVVGSHLNLLRSVVVVPAYSTLVLKAELSSSQGLLASGLVEYNSYCGYSETIFPNGNGCVDVNLRWGNAYPLIYKEAVMQWEAEFTTKGIESNIHKPSENITQQLVSPFSNRNRLWQPEGVEIFTIYIDGINHEDFSTVYGSIKVYCDCTPFYIYNRSQSDAERLPSDKTLSIESHDLITNVEFNIVLDLKDAAEDLEITWAEVSCSRATVKYASSMSWYDKRICSVDRGAHGYAAVHYMIFRHAIRATLEVSLIGDNLGYVPLNLYGLICARYGEYEYPTEYEKIYYQSKIFNRPRDKPEKLSSGDTVPLLKSVMAMPSTSSLIIEANLKAIRNDNSHEVAVSGTQEFLIDLTRPNCKEIGGGVCRIKVSIIFKDDGLLS